MKNSTQTQPPGFHSPPDLQLEEPLGAVTLQQPVLQSASWAECFLLCVPQASSTTQLQHTLL